MKIKKIICTVVFLGIFLACYLMAGKLFLYKNFYNQVWPTTSGFAKFYKMEKNSVDVIFFGTSHAVNGFYPQELYKTHRIKSYNLGCEQQNMVVAYYWLLEALKTQSPKVVIIEPYTVLRPEIDIASREGLIRKSVDPMKFSKNKIHLVKDICRLDANQTFLSYVFPLMRFHGRWKNLNEDDFSYRQMIAHDDMLGASMRNGKTKDKYVPFAQDLDNKTVTFNENQKEYLDKMIATCKENDIQVLLVLNPTFGTVAYYNTLCAYAKEREVDFFDFNEATLYNAIGYDLQQDNNDRTHVARRGAVKITNYLGKILKEQFGVPLHFNNRAYEKSQAYYRELNENFDLMEIADINKYLPRLKRERYSVFISARDEASAGLSDEARKKLSELGLRLDLKDHYRESYFAVISGGKVLHEQMGKERLSCTGSIRGGRSIYTVVSAGLPYGNVSQITIDGRGYSKNRRGLNIVLYDDEQHKVIDSVAFDTCDKAMKAYR